MELNGEVGVKICEIVDDTPPALVNVTDTSEDEWIYNDHPIVVIRGTGFNPVQNALRFYNDIMGDGANYTITATDATTMILTLVEGSHWADPNHLPTTLYVRAVNTGSGFINVGPANSVQGQPVARVFAKPTVLTNTARLYRTKTYSFQITGGDFRPVVSGARPQLIFVPSLVAGVDYTARMVDSEVIEVTLLEGRAWRASAGTLFLSSLNTRGDSRGWITFEGNGIIVAEIVEDDDSLRRIELLYTTQYIYDTSPKLSIRGRGFDVAVDEIFLQLGVEDQVLVQNVDYFVATVLEESIILQLYDSKM